MPAPPYSSGTVMPKQPQLAHLAPQLGGKHVVAVDLGGQRLDPLLRPAMHHLAQGVDLLAQLEPHAGGEHRLPSREPVRASLDRAARARQRSRRADQMEIGRSPDRSGSTAEPKPGTFSEAKATRPSTLRSVGPDRVAR